MITEKQLSGRNVPVCFTRLDEDVCLGKKLEMFVPQILRCPLLPNALIHSDFLHVAGGWALVSSRKQTQTGWIVSPGSCSVSSCFMYKPSEMSMSCSTQIQPAPALQPQHFQQALQQSSYLCALGTDRPYNTGVLSRSHLGCSGKEPIARARPKHVSVV